MYNDQVGAFLSNPEKKRGSGMGGGGISKGSFKHKGPSHFLTCLIHTQCRRPALAPKPLSKSCLSFVPLTVSTLLGSFLLSNQDAFLTAPTCKVLIARPRGSTFIPRILIRSRLRHMGAKRKQCGPAKKWPLTRLQGRDVFHFHSLGRYKPSELSLQPGLFLKQEPSGCRQRMMAVAILGIQLRLIFIHSQSHNLRCLFFMMVERGGSVFLGNVLNPPILQRSPRALHLFSYTNSIRALITVH